MALFSSFVRCSHCSGFLGYFSVVNLSLLHNITRCIHLPFQINGLCGNWNGYRDDDFYPYGLERKGTYSEIGISYKVGKENETDPA